MYNANMNFIYVKIYLNKKRYNRQLWLTNYG